MSNEGGPPENQPSHTGRLSPADGSSADTQEVAQTTAHPATRLELVRTWLGLERNVVVMLAVLLIVGMGEELWLRFLPKYLETLGAGAWAIAAYGTLRDLLDAVYPYPGGWLTDRLGRRRALVLFAALALLGYGIYLFSPSWEWILGGTLLVMAWSSLTLPALFAIIGDTLPRTRRAIGFGVQSILKRFPIVLAPLLGGWLIATWGMRGGIQIGLVMTIGLALAAMFVVRHFYVEKPVGKPDATRFIAVWRQMDPHLKRLLIADSLARWAEGIPKVFVILYVIDVLGVDVLQFGGLTSVQMLAAILVYIPIAKLSDRLNRKPFVLVTFAFFALFPLMLVWAADFAWVVLAFVIAGLREIGEPARKALIVDLAAETLRGRAVGMYYLVRGLVVFPASLVGGWLWTLHVQLPFYVAFVIGVIGLATYALWGPGEAPEWSEQHR